MKLASIPEVRLDAINAGLKSFFTRHSMKVIQLTGARRKRLLRAFSEANAYASLRGWRYDDRNSLTLVWHRYGGEDGELGTHSEFNVWTDADSLLTKNLDNLSASIIRDCKYFKLRVWVGGIQRYFLFNLRKE